MMNVLPPFWHHDSYNIYCLATLLVQRLIYVPVVWCRLLQNNLSII